MRQQIRKTLIFSLLLMAIGLLLMGCGTAGEVEVDGNGTGAQPPQNIPTYFVEEMTINLMESFPVQVSVSVRGNLADGCTSLENITSRRDGQTFELDIETSHSGQEACAAIAPPFEQSVALDVEGLPAGTYTVKAGEKTSTFTLEMDNSAVSTTNASDVTITLERTACFGFCPIYHLTIHGDGTVEYEGIDFVEVKGKQSSNIGADAVSGLVDAFREAGYFDWNDAYTEYYVSDMPSAITSITLGGERKQIEHYEGDESAPEELMRLEKLIDSVANSAQWIGNGGAIEPDVAQPPQNTPAYFVEEMTINLMESFPVQVSVSVRGNLADGCTELEHIASRRDGQIFELDIETSHSGQEACAAIAPPFEQSVALDVEGLPAGTYTVKVGEKTSTFTLDMDNGDVSTTNVSDVTITLERTACFGTCPIYHLTIHGDGTVEYEGIDFVEVEGKQSSNIGADAVSDLVIAFVEAGYFDWNDAYNEYNVTDMPSVITSITLDGERKRIDHYRGDESAPEELMKLENLIDSVANSAQWIGNGEAPLPTEVMLAGTTWLFSWGEIDGEGLSSFAGIPMTLDFTADQINGYASCNNFFGGYVVEGERLTIGPIGATRRACEPDIAELELKFLTALESVQSFTHDPDSLTLTLPNGALHFTANMIIEKTLFVGAEQVDCQGVAPQTCYLVKEDPNAEWEYFYDKIAGFQWEAGYEYELRVRVIPVENPPADASSLIYELIEVVSQNPTQ